MHQVDLPPPFNFLPKPLVESTGNAALATSVNIILVSVPAYSTANPAMCTMGISCSASSNICL